MSDTIYAAATAPGRAAVAVIRVSGPRAREAVRTLAGRAPRAREAVVRTLRDGQGAHLRAGIDRADLLRGQLHLGAHSGTAFSAHAHAARIVIGPHAR